MHTARASVNLMEETNVGCKHPYVIILKWGLDTLSVHLGILVDRVALGLNILRVIRLLFLVIIPKCPHLLSTFIMDSA